MKEKRKTDEHFRKKSFSSDLPTEFTALIQEVPPHASRLTLLFNYHFKQDFKNNKSFPSNIYHLQITNIYTKIIDYASRTFICAICAAEDTSLGNCLRLLGPLFSRQNQHLQNGVSFDSRTFI